MAQILRVAAVQLTSGIEPVANRAAALPLIREAAAAGARLVATPEMTTRLDRDRTRARAALADHDHEAELRSWARIAEEHGVWLLLGSLPWPGPDGRAFNRSVLFNPGGKIIARYDKIHMFDVTLGGGEAYRESEAVEPGVEAVVAEGPQGVKLGLTICYDLRFPHLYRRLAQAGAHILMVPAAFTVPTGVAHWETLLRARAIETGAFVIAPAQGGHHEDGRATYGHTMIVGPWGEVKGLLPHDAPGLAIADLDLDDVAAARGKIPAWSFDREFKGP
jgi:predicted amidohydrolase